MTFLAGVVTGSVLTAAIAAGGFVVLRWIRRGRLFLQGLEQVLFYSWRR